MSPLTELKSRATKALDSYKSSKAIASVEQDALADAKERLQIARQCQDIIQSIASAVQQHAHEQIAKVVTKCLQTVFGDEYAFKINFVERRGRTDAEMVFLKGGIEIDPLDGDSGGVMEVAAFALRLTCLALATPKQRPLVVLDEPFKSVHGDRPRQAVAGMVESLSRDLGIQVIMVTGLDWLKTGNIISVEPPS